jgi:dynein heavy chain
VYLQISAKDYDEGEYPETYKPLMFCLSIFHAVVLERRKFGSLGWNIPYEWMNSDFEISQKHLLLYLSSDLIPFQTLITMIGTINYGGRVTDSNDEKAVSSLLKIFFNEQAVNEGYSFGSNDLDDIYVVPNTETIGSILNYINQLPLNDVPSIFGLNSNASINLELNSAKDFMNQLALIEMNNTNTSVDSSDQLQKLVRRMLSVVPNSFPTSSEYQNSPLLVFRDHEIEKYNILLNKIKSSLTELADALKGLIVMSMELER